MTAQAMPLAGQCVLLVENEYLIAMDLVSDFEDQGAQVLGPAPSVDEALRLIEGANRIDSAVLNINLNGEVVFPVVDALMERDIPFLFLTGYDQAAIPAHYTDVAHYMKPMNPAKVVGTLSKLRQRPARSSLACVGLPQDT